uniref:PiggyBac transposable element-derived protein domain-containing protein n=1 Tax=Acrobeloides nanus TaxID=290746 RepID=A0A914BYB3_9BILA
MDDDDVYRRETSTGEQLVDSALDSKVALELEQFSISWEVVEMKNLVDSMGQILTEDSEDSTESHPFGSSSLWPAEGDNQPPQPPNNTMSFSRLTRMLNKTKKKHKLYQDLVFQDVHRKEDITRAMSLSSVQLFEKFFDEEVLSHIVAETNRYASARENPEFNDSLEELKVFFGITPSSIDLTTNTDPSEPSSVTQDYPKNAEFINPVSMQPGQNVGPAQYVEDFRMPPTQTPCIPVGPSCSKSACKPQETNKRKRGAPVGSRVEDPNDLEKEKKRVYMQRPIELAE